METTEVHGGEGGGLEGFAGIISPWFNVLPWRRNYCNGKQTIGPHFNKTFPSAKSEKSSQVITTNILSLGEAHDVLKSQFCKAGSERQRLLPARSTRTESQSRPGNKGAPGRLPAPRQRQQDRCSRFARDAPASANNSCHVGKSEQGDGKLLRAFS